LGSGDLHGFIGIRRLKNSKVMLVCKDDDASDVRLVIYNQYGSAHNMPQFVLD
jgi:hypothetical protein